MAKKENSPAPSFAEEIVSKLKEHIGSFIPEEDDKLVVLAGVKFRIPYYTEDRIEPLTRTIFSLGRIKGKIFIDISPFFDKKDSKARIPKDIRVLPLDYAGILSGTELCLMDDALTKGFFKVVEMDPKDIECRTESASCWFENDDEFEKFLNS